MTGKEQTIMESSNPIARHTGRTATVSGRISRRLQSMSAACCIAVMSIIALINLLATMCYPSPYSFSDPYFDAAAVLLGIIMAVGMLVLLAYADNAVSRFRLRHVGIVCIIAVGVMAAVWITMNRIIRNDPPNTIIGGDTRMVIGYAREIFSRGNDGVRYDMENEYLQRYPYQSGAILMMLPIVALTMRLDVNMAELLLEYANIPVIMLAAAFIVIIAWLMKGADAAKHAAIMSVMFAPLWMSAIQVYANIYSLPFLLAMTALAVAFSKTRGTKPAVASSAGVLAAAFILGALKPNNLIMGIAVMLTLVLIMLACPHHEGRLKPILAAIMAMLVIPLMLAGGVAAQSAVEKLSGIEFDKAKAQPTSLFIGMGLGDESDHGKGFYLTAIGGAWSDMDKQAEKADASINNRLNQMRTDPMGAAGFFSMKTLQTWSDPTYSYAIRNGAKTRSHADVLAALFPDWKTQPMKETAGQRIVNTNAFMIAMRTWCDGIGIIISGLAVMGVWRVRKQPALTLPALCVLGGFLFHIAWETQPEYAFTYFIMLIPYAGIGAHVLMDALRTHGSIRLPFLNLNRKEPDAERQADGSARPAASFGADVSESDCPAT